MAGVASDDWQIQPGNRILRSINGLSYTRQLWCIGWARFPARRCRAKARGSPTARDRSPHSDLPNRSRSNSTTAIPAPPCRARRNFRPRGTHRDPRRPSLLHSQYKGSGFFWAARLHASQQNRYCGSSAMPRVRYHGRGEQSPPASVAQTETPRSSSVWKTRLEFVQRSRPSHSQPPSRP